MNCRVLHQMFGKLSSHELSSPWPDWPRVG